MEDLPEYIEGIPTDKKASKERREIIKREYIRLIEHLQNSRGAVKHLETIIREASPLKGGPIYTLPKPSGKQKEFGYVNIATLYYESHSEEHDYMNFTIKLVLGIKNEGRHVQYSVNKVEMTQKSIL